MTEGEEGLDINFFDVQGTTPPSGTTCREANFVETNVTTGLSRAVPHTIKITMDLLEGPSNDVVKVYVDGALKHTGTSWEDYFRYDAKPLLISEGHPSSTGFSSAPAAQRLRRHCCAAL